MSETIVVISSAHAGYRRGGVELEQGPNVFDTGDFTKAQLEQLRTDPRLTIAEGDAGETASADSPDATQGAVDADRVAELVAHIRTLDKDDASLWKEDNTPKAAAFPKGATAEERQKAWDTFTAELDKA